MNVLQPTFIVNYTGKQIDEAINFFNTSVAEVYDSTKNYVVDDFVIYDGFLYQCLEDCTGTWNISKWQIQKLFDNNGLFIFNGEDAPVVKPSPFYIEAIEDMTIALTWDLDAAPDVVVKYGINDTSVPNDYISDDEISLTAGQKCYWFANFNEAEDIPYAMFYGEGKFNVGGNLSDLIGGETTIPFDEIFCDLFGYSEVVDASELVIIDDFNETGWCYCYMFEECTSLTTPPQLPATTLADGCYGGMFYGCTSLTTPPQLPATILADYCYDYMFTNCTSLTTAPELPATTLASGCYEGMFSGCTSLTTPPELPVTTLADHCYYDMFDGCTSLTTAPELPATTLAEYCYEGMFLNCTSLTTPPELPATTLAHECYRGIFQGCTSLITPPELPATTLEYGCYRSMFYGCTSLSTLPELPAIILADDCYRYMCHDCTNIKLSTTQTGNYQIPYKIPSSGTGTVGTDSLFDMFTGTGGTFTGTPSINTTYYTQNTSV